MKKLLGIMGLILGLTSLSHAGVGTAVPATLSSAICISSVSVAGGQAQVTVPAPANPSVYSSGYYNYITHLRIEQYAASTLTGGASPTTCTTTNLFSKAFKFPTALATGAMTVFDQELTNALQSTQGLTTVITCPATANVIWNMDVCYFVAN